MQYFQINRSLIFLVIAILIHVFAFVVVVPLSLPWFVLSSLAGFIVLSLLVICAKWLSGSGQTISAMCLAPDGQWFVVPRSGELLPVTLLNHSLVTRGFSLLYIRSVTTGKLKTLLILSDSMTVEAYHRLRFCLVRAVK